MRVPLLSPRAALPTLTASRKPNPSENVAGRSLCPRRGVPYTQPSADSRPGAQCGHPSSRSPRLSEQVLRPPNGLVRASAWRSCQPPWLARCAERADVIEGGAQAILLGFEVVAGLEVHPEPLGGTEI